jgi:secondary thiamine-phosphate synthase enzyme
VIKGMEMSDAVVYCDSIEVSLRTGPDMDDITGALQRVVERSGVREGHLAAAVVGSTGSLTTIEFEPGVVEDLRRAIERLAPPGLDYAHEKAWHDGNGHSHVQAALLGPSVSVAVRGGRLRLGTWQQVIAINHDNGPRNRTIEVTVFGKQ